MDNEIKNKWGMCCDSNKGIVAALLIAAILYVAAQTYSTILKSKFIGRDIAAATTISVSGDADVYASPDLAVMDFSVTSFATTVLAAMNDNNTKMNAIGGAVKALGVEAKDLQTTNFNISPRYDFVKRVVTPPVPLSTPSLAPGTGSGSAGSASSPVIDYYPNGKQVLSGYDVTATLTVKMRDLSKVGDIIQAATTAGANQAGSLQFTIDNPDALQAQAREQAITKAKAQAEVLANQLKVKLVRIVSFSENGVRPMVYNAKSVAMDSAVGAAPAPAIETGQNKISDSVSITYEIQ